MTFGPRHPCRFMMEDQIEMKSVHIWETPTERRIFTDVFRSLSFLVKGWPNEYREAAWQAELGRISYSFHCSRRRGRHPCCSRRTGPIEARTRLANAPITTLCPCRIPTPPKASGTVTAHPGFPLRTIDHARRPTMSDQVEQLARTLWEKAGKPEGRDEEFWLAAEKLCAADEQRGDKKKADDPGIGTPNPAAIVGGD